MLTKPPPNALIEEVGDSNIVIRFIGWIDQRTTDFMKARSCAIPVVKNALEEAGFAIPEPIYRLRFDQTEQVPAQKTGATPRPARKPKRAPAEASDVELSAGSPIKAVERMVDEERAEGGKAGDLLDTRRPVE